MFEINGPFYSNYNGSDIKVELILKTDKGTFGPKMGTFETYNSTDSDGTGTGVISLEVFEDLNAPLDTQSILKLMSGSSELFIQTTLNGETRVIKYNLNGFSKVYDNYRNNNVNPFEK